MVKEGFVDEGRGRDGEWSSRVEKSCMRAVWLVVEVDVETRPYMNNTKDLERSHVAFALSLLLLINFSV